MDWSEIIDKCNLSISADYLRKTAYGLIEYDNYLHCGGSATTRILSISDLHIPFNLPLSTFSEYNGIVDILVLNGDIEDCQSTSKFVKSYRVDLIQEMVMTREYIIGLINMIKPKKVYITKGNHEARLGKYLANKLNSDVLNLLPDSPIDYIINEGFTNKDRYNKTETYYEPLRNMFIEQGIDIVYERDWFVKVGKTIFAHPLAYSSVMLRTTQKAVDFFLRKDRDFDTVVLGHTHKLGSFVQGDIHLFEQGCCCDNSKLDYADGKLFLPNQNGFIYICQNSDGSFNKNSKLIDIETQ